MTDRIKGNFMTDIKKTNKAELIEASKMSQNSSYENRAYDSIIKQNNPSFSLMKGHDPTLNSTTVVTEPSLMEATDNQSSIIGKHFQMIPKDRNASDINFQPLSLMNASIQTQLHNTMSSLKAQT
jgi:hypothetical protein